MDALADFVGTSNALQKQLNQKAKARVILSTSRKAEAGRPENPVNKKIQAVATPQLYPRPIPPNPMRNTTHSEHKQQKTPPCHIPNQAAYPEDHI